MPRLPRAGKKNPAIENRSPQPTPNLQHTLAGHRKNCTCERKESQVHHWTCERFNATPLGDLENLTGIGSSSWCRWFKGGTTIAEDSLIRAASKLSVTPGYLLDLILCRRIEQQAVTPSGKNYTPKKYQRYYQTCQIEETG